MKYIRLIFILFAAILALIFAFRSADEVKPPVSNGVGSKINGVSFVAPPQPVSEKALQPIKNVNANWVAITPYAFGREGSADMRFNVSRQWWGEREEGVVATIKHAQDLGLKVMLKPHVWVRGQGWAGDFELDSEAAWKEWEANYRDYILSFAKVADSLNIGMYCIGTEYRKAAVQRPDFWKQLISDVRKVYDGKITYAANWDNYQNIPFWDDLDYIGIDAYFAISEQRDPSVEHLKEQWILLKKQLKAFSSSNDKPVLFAEFGYQSVDYTAAGHWNYERDERSLNMEAQVNAYQALFETFWSEPWFAGGFLWKWFDRHPERGGSSDKRFTPQNKPAEETIREWYGRAGQ